MEVKPPPESRDMHSEIILQDDSGSNTVGNSEDQHQEESNVSRGVENKVEELLLEKCLLTQKNESKNVLQKAESVSDQVETKMNTVQGEKGSLRKERNIVESKYEEDDGNEHSADFDF